MIPRYPIRIVVPGQAASTFEPWQFREMPHEVQLSLSMARRLHGHAECLCQQGDCVPKLSIRQLGSMSTLARYPGGGPDHAEDCPFTGDPPSIMASRSDPELPSERELLEALWEKAGLDQWKPAFDPRTWSTATSRLVGAASTLDVGGTGLSDQLVVIPWHEFGLHPDQKAGAVLEAASAKGSEVYVLGQLHRLPVAGPRAVRIPLWRGRQYRLTLFARPDCLHTLQEDEAVRMALSREAPSAPDSRRAVALLRAAPRRSPKGDCVGDVRALAALAVTREFVPWHSAPQGKLASSLIERGREFRIALSPGGPAAWLLDTAEDAKPLFVGLSDAPPAAWRWLPETGEIPTFPTSRSNRI